MNRARAPDQPPTTRLGMEQLKRWECIYQRGTDAEISWRQERPTLSLSLLDSLATPVGRAIDVGGGQSALAGALLLRGVREVTVVDISPSAIERGQRRHGAATEKARWLVADVLEARDLGEYDLWHDRAVFHFFTAPAERRRYVAAAARAVLEGGHAIISTFAPHGPERCSGLPVCRDDASALASEFSPLFELVGSASEVHLTPWGAAQPFSYAVLRRA